MKKPAPVNIAALTPLLVLPLVTVPVIHQFDAVPDFLQGLATGVSIAMLLAYCILMGGAIRAKRDAADRRALDDLDPLGGLARTDLPDGDAR